MKRILIIGLYIYSLNLQSQEKSTVNVEVNPEVSLFSIVTYLSGHTTFVIPSSYQNLVKKTFKPYKKHPAVSLIKKMYKNKNVEIESTHPIMGLYCTTLPNLKPNFILQKNISEEEFENYLKYLRNFSDEIAYLSFVEQQQSEFESWTNPVKDTISKYKLADRLGSFFGYHKNFKICLDPFNSWGGKAFIPNDSSFVKNNAWFILGYNIYREDGSDITKSPKFDYKFMLVDLVWHEGTHTYINPLIDMYKTKFEPYSALLDKELQEKLQKAGRFKWNWNQFIKEQITRSVVAYLQLKYFGEKEWEKECLKQYNIGFVYTKEISNILKKYDENRNAKTEFTNVFQHIINYFETIID
ncbi:hypothetical protein FLAVO9AF_10119 [Flavobacterium sp. 9AF]|uniref:DUF4932 domain-containing protein n=1 Tax=Flavobacterium sp. 9AF TaxID=2653142 RepID=UPI0012F1A28B|nr:DUF4932 domain-containing protein [Flavobacterium sp. 9AF]VXA94967.1 hypothetical protein FLAVO9AF_10119 [Flavobacterium sp. 9AF]